MNVWNMKPILNKHAIVGATIKIYVVKCSGEVGLWSIAFTALHSCRLLLSVTTVCRDYEHNAGVASLLQEIFDKS